MRKKITQTVHILRAKSPKTRRAIMLAASFGVTGLLVLIWLLSFSFSHRNNPPVLSPEDQAKSPFTIIKDSVVEVYDGDSAKPSNTTEVTGN